MSLATYNARRNFRRTLEPSGLRRPRARSRRPRDAAPLFVSQKHAARRLHYDFRLEMDGALKSWAVPKGIPTTKGDKRLAVHVEDHPLEYAAFEGTIPPGNYGAGTVMVWDTGPFELVEGDAKTAVPSGKVVVRLHGKKLEGEWTLVRIRSRSQSEEDPWLLIKTDRDARKISARLEDSSAQSGRTMKQIGADDSPETRWESNRKASSSRRPAASDGEPTGKVPEFIEPMKARLVTDLPSDDGWLFEVKLDGIRAIVSRDGDRLKLWSRRPRDLTDAYPGLADACRQLPAKRFVADGEIVTLDEKGRSSFQLLQNRRRAGPSGRRPVFLYLFDLLHLDGRDLRGLPLEERKRLLEGLLKSPPAELRYSASLRAPARKIWSEVKRLGLEGIIAKQKSSKYEPGRRSGAWLKIKTHNEQEFVIGGYTPPEGSRKHFGAVVVGYYAAGRLQFASRVGTGFTFESLSSLYAKFQRLRASKCPFHNLPSPRGQPNGVTVAEMRRCVWLKPQLVCQVKFMEWTRDGNLRHPVFLGLRDDLKPQEVGREQPKTA